MKYLKHICRLYKFFFLAMMVFSGLSATAGKYNVANIPDHLKENARAVVRENHVHFEVRNENRARRSVHRVITILERRAEGLADLQIHHDDNIRIRSYSGTIYDAQGKKVRDLRRNEFTDHSATASFSLFSDNRVLFTDIYRSQLPFTVEFHYEVEYRNGFFPPNWHPQFTTGLSVENSSFSITAPLEIQYRHRVINMDDITPSRSTDRRNTTTTWKVENLSAIKHEPYMPSTATILPILMIGSGRFSYEGYSGSMNTWEEYGAWILSLNNGLQDLPESARATVRDLTSGVEDKKEKIRILYEYMQSKTRYVSIDLGIGGFQPFDAATVDQTGYGDCKALSNYMMALLQEAGIDSYYTLIHSGTFSSIVLPDFPSKAFNHAILAVPVENDTIWLECTSNHFPMGHIGSSNANRRVLLITPEGGKLVRTPRYEHPENQRIRKIEAVLQANGNLELNRNTRYKGLRFDDPLGISLQGAGQQLRYLQQNIGINNPEIVEVSYSRINDPIPVMEENITVKTNQYISRAGSRILFNPNIFSKRESVPGAMENRVHKIQIHDTALYSDTVNWKLPAGFEVTHLPEDVLIDNEFGFFQAKYLLEGDQLIYERTYFARRGIHPPEKYQEFLRFFSAIHSSDRTQVVLSRN